jgi:hypothetical protein
MYVGSETLNHFVWASLEGFVTGAAVFFTLFKLRLIARGFRPTIEEAFRND